MKMDSFLYVRERNRYTQWLKRTAFITWYELYKLNKMVDNFEGKICSYCNERPAVMQFKNGKYCCELSRSKCPDQRAKNARGNTGRKHSEETKCKISSGNKGRDFARAEKYNNINGDLCDYGCGKKAEYKYKKTGKLCCEEIWYRCSEQKRKNSERKIIELNEPERNKRLRENVKKSWIGDTDRKIYFSKLMKDRWENFTEEELIEIKRKKSKSMKDKWKDPEFRLEMEAIFHSEEYKEILRKSTTELWKTEEYRSKIEKIFNLEDC